MGCFSYLCKECGTGINSSSFEGERVKLFLLKEGVISQQMEGQYDSYGRVFMPGNNDSVKWDDDWGDICSLHFDSSNLNGIAAVHSKCYVNDPETISEDDPDQGWNDIRRSHLH